MGNILVNRLTSLGDVICTEPLLRALYESKQFDNVTINTNLPEIFYNHPINFLDKKDEYQIYLDLTSVCENKLHLNIVDAYLDAFKLTLPPDQKLPRLYLSEAEEVYGKSILNQEYRWVVFDFGYPMTEAFLQGYNNNKYTIWQRAFWEIKDWLPIVHFVKLNKLKIVVVGNLIGNYIDKNCITDILNIDLNLIGETSIRELFSIINAAEFFIGMDSGPMHIAKSFFKKGVAVFNPNHPSNKLMQKGSLIEPVHRLILENLNCEEIINKFYKILKGEDTKKCMLV